MMNRLQIKPVYGYGWREPGGQLIDVPAPFGVDVESMEGRLGESGNRFTGTVVGSHIFAGKIARLDVRTVGQPSHYNVSIYEKLSPSEPEVSRERMSDTVVVTGYAELM